MIDYANESNSFSSLAAEQRNQQAGVMFQGFFRLSKPRQFTYSFRYYQPQDEEKRIQFKKLRKSEPRQGSSILRLAILLIVLTLLFIYMQKKSSAPNAGTRTIIVEEVIVVD